ncbi:MAG: SDR family oxidoreductase [Chitinophagaceae bacterium]|nr:MAG: SDR family oxidoreductase [Chitinophagaceae bacterium]
MEKPLKVLITGSNGLLGQKLVALLANHPNTCLTACSRGVNRNPDAHGYQYEALDLTDHASARALISQIRPDVIIHTAAMSSVDACEADPKSCREINVLAVRNLGKVCAETGAHLIHLSTDFVFDGTEGPYREVDGMNPLSIYGKSKVESELLLENTGCKWSVIRTILVYGVLKDLSRPTIVSWVKDNLEQKKEIRVIDDQFRMPTLVEDLADACCAIAKGGHQGVYHICGKDHMSIAALAHEVAHFFGLDTSLISHVSSSELPNAHLRPANTGFSLEKAMHTFNYSPRSFQEGLALLAKQWKK